MSEVIRTETAFFLWSFGTGVAIMFGYDIIRAFRIVCRHNSFFVSLEDIVFWTAAGVAAFFVTWIKNEGILRGFSVMAMVVGAVLYYKTASFSVFSLFSTLFILTRRRILFPFFKINKKMQKITLKLLKNIKKEFKIIFNITRGNS